MPLDTNSVFIAEKNKPSNQPVFLYSLFDYDGLGNNLYFAEYDSDVIYQSANDTTPITYTGFPITHDNIGENTNNQIDNVRISLSNVSRLIQAYLEIYELRGKKLSVKMVWANQLGDPDAFVEHSYYVDSWTADQDTVTFTVSSKFDVMQKQLPGRNYSRTSCNWAPRFKGVECGYSGPGTTCDGTLQQCRIYNNVLRFGAEPAVPSQKIFNV